MLTFFVAVIAGVLVGYALVKGVANCIGINF